MDIQKTIDNLSANNMRVHRLDNKAEVIPYLQKLIPEGSKVGCGGSVTLTECGVLEFLRNGSYTFYDRKSNYDNPGITNAEIEEIFSNEKHSDFYLCSSNAITESGELYNVDSRANRVSCIAHGPKKIIIVAGVNKIVENLEAAIIRVKSTVAPQNCKRVNVKTFCSAKGKCVSLGSPNFSMTSGCQSPSRICCSYLVSGFQKIKDRITVLLVNETLGY